jgi:hypothetical protein
MKPLVTLSPDSPNNDIVGAIRTGHKGGTWSTTIISFRWRRL